MNSENSLSAADIAAVTGNRGGMGGFGYGDGSFIWIIILFLFCMFNGGWGNNNGGMNGMGGMYPWLNQQSQINDGFQNQMLFDNVSSIRDGVYNIGPQIQNGFAQAEISSNARQMADMNQMFALQSQLAQCCCDNRLASCQTQNIIQNEGNMTRFADANNTRDIIESNNQGFQKVMDKLCQLELDGLKQDNANLRTQLNMANLQASQVSQTGAIRDSIISELRSCPIPSQPVYGNSPIFSCNGNQGCGCSGNSFYN